MHDETPPGPADEHADATAPSVQGHEHAPPTIQQRIFCLDIAPDDVAVMVRYRHASRVDETQIRILAGVSQLRNVGTPPDYRVDAVDVIGTRWDGHSPTGLHRVVCLLERTPDERSVLQHLIFVGLGGAIAIPPVEGDVRDLNDFRVVYAQGAALLPP